MGSYTTCAADGSSCATYPWPQVRWPAAFSFAHAQLHAGVHRRPLASLTPLLRVGDQGYGYAGYPYGTVSPYSSTWAPC